MRELFSVIFFILALALSIGSILSVRSGKSIGASVGLLVGALVPPVIGNMIIISSEGKLPATLGCYIYFLGMDVVMYALMRFTSEYCMISWPRKEVRYLAWVLLVLDAVQLLLNPLFGHAFDTEALMVDGSAYYRLVPYAGQTFHRLVDYGIFFVVLMIFLTKMVRTPRIYSERYSVIFFTMMLTGIWESYYIVSRTPIDRSMIGFAVFGILVFYFSIYYKPVRLLDRMLANIASGIPDAMFFFDAVGRCIWANDPGIRLVRIGQEDYFPAAGRILELFGEGGSREEEWICEKEISGEDEVRYYTLENHTVMDEHGRFNGSFLAIRDITSQQLALQKEKYNATHDPLTDLYTKEHLFGEIRRHISEQGETPSLVLFIDVNDFKIVNDIYGHDFGDDALRSLADWIRSESGEGSLYGRIGGDTFGVFLPVADFHPDYLDRRLAHFEVRSGSVSHAILIHVGVYEVTEKGLDVSVMFDRARMALSTIKGEYQVHIAYYDDEMRDKVLWDQHISGQLADAIRERQIRPYLQAIVNSEGQVVGCEALVRWIHPEDGFLSPASFIPVFEENGMIAEVDRYMWRSACEILANWKEEGREGFISVNVSPKDFYFMDVAAELRRIVEEYEVDPSRLRVEITETVMMTDIENRVQILRELKEAGFIVEMDDFGSGYSSLNMLKDMPVDIIKIDMKFLNAAGDDEKAHTILRNVIRMSHELGLLALTEGVETAEQRRMLTEMGCRLFQGYYFARPLSVEDFERT